jgi:hypothetical protein
MFGEPELLLDVPGPVAALRAKFGNLAQPSPHT